MRNSRTIQRDPGGSTAPIEVCPQADPCRVALDFLKPGSGILALSLAMAVCLFICIRPVFAQTNAPAQPRHGQTGQSGSLSHQDTLSHPSTKIIELLDFKNADIRDVVRAIASKYHLNIFVEEGIDHRVTLHLEQVPVAQALDFIASQYGLELEREGGIFKFKQPFIPEPEPPPLTIEYQDSLLTVDLKNEDLHKVMEELSRKTGRNVVVNQGVQGSLTGFLQQIPFEQGLAILLNSNGFLARERNGVFLVDRHYRAGEKNGSAASGAGFWVTMQDTLINIEVTKASIGDVIKEMFLQAGMDVVFYQEVEGEITARWTNLTLEEALNYLLRGTNYTYRKENGIYMIGASKLQGINSAKLIRLKYLSADNVLELLPKAAGPNASVTLVKEHNGLMVTGTQEGIQEIEAYIEQVDQPIPQVLIEALVVDFNRQKLGEFGVKAGIGATADSSSGFASLFPGLDFSVSGSELNSILDTYGGGIGISRIAKLPANFYLQIKALETEGKANVRSRPQIATLSGHTASIKIGTTQYFILRTATPISGSNQVVVQESERFETISAEMILEVTPWVTANGEIITKIHPEFSTPKNGLDSSVPPTIDHRVLDSTVKLKDGETIILGGLIQEFDNETVRKFPLLGHLPLIGKLFQSRSYNKTTAELMIYLTPHIYYVGDESGPAKGVIK